MKKLILGLILLTLPSPAFASSASSTIENHVSANSSNGDSQVSSHTDVTVETNGQTTHYSSDQPNQSVKVESNNGASSITVNGQKISGSPTEKQTPTVSNSPTPSRTIDKPQHPNVNSISKLFEELRKFFLHFFGR